jgi:hypothetical protein
MYVSAPDHAFRLEDQGRRGFYSWWVNGDADNASCGTPIKGAALSSNHRMGQTDVRGASACEKRE